MPSFAWSNFTKKCYEYSSRSLDSQTDETDEQMKHERKEIRESSCSASKKKTFMGKMWTSNALARKTIEYLFLILFFV